MRPLSGVLCGCTLFVLLMSLPFQTYVMPHLDDSTVSLAERLRSAKFGDSYGYGRYAEGILARGELSAIDGTPIVKHMPGLPLLLAWTFRTFGSIRPFLAAQVVFAFASLYFLLTRVRDGFPALAVVMTPIVIALHPSTIKHASGAMTDLLFGSLLMWVAFLLWKRAPGFKDFLCVGIVFGVAVYLRESALAFMLMTAAAYIVRDPKRYLAPAGVMAAAFAVMLAPWAIRNQRLTHRFTPLTTKTADLFYYNSIPLTPALYTPFGAGFQEGGYNYAKLYDSYHAEAARAGVAGSGRLQPARDVYNSWANRPLPANPIAAGLRNYLSRPAEQLRSTLLKTIALLNKPAVLADLASTRAAPLLVAGNIFFYAFHVGVMLFAIGLAFIRRHNPFLFLPYWIAGQYVLSLLFWSEERYLMPFYPFLVLIALSWYERACHSLVVSGFALRAKRLGGPP